MHFDKLVKLVLEQAESSSRIFDFKMIGINLGRGFNNGKEVLPTLNSMFYCANTTADKHIYDELYGPLMTSNSSKTLYASNANINTHFFDFVITSNNTYYNTIEDILKKQCFYNQIKSEVTDNIDNVIDCADAMQTFIDTCSKDNGNILYNYPCAPHAPLQLAYYINGRECSAQEYYKFCDDRAKQRKLNKELTSQENPVFDKDFLDEL